MYIRDRLRPVDPSLANFSIDDSSDIARKHFKKSWLESIYFPYNTILQLLRVKIAHYLHFCCSHLTL